MQLDGKNFDDDLNDGRNANKFNACLGGDNNCNAPFSNANSLDVTTGSNFSGDFLQILNLGNSSTGQHDDVQLQMCGTPWKPE